MSEGKDRDDDTAEEKPVCSISSYIQLDEYHNAINYLENATEDIYSKYKFTPYK